jgi:hypothetical protein
MLIKAKFFSYATSPEEVAVQNFMKDVLWDAECFPMFQNPDTPDITQFVSKLF